jgi:NAD(P)-dependent dehydrogenase (short-subunit alcohol dehydrogenase family)
VTIVNNLQFKDKVVFISGGTSGIGLATAVQFALGGAAHIIVCGRRESKWHEAQKYIDEKLTTEQKNRIQYWPCDVRVELQVKNTIEQIFTKYGRLDICFNNAGVQPGIVTGDDSGFITTMFFESSIAADGSIIYRIPPPQPDSGSEFQNATREPTQTTPASPFCESELATSCIGVFYCVKWQIHYIFEKQPATLPASIINTSSRNGVLPDSHRPLYASSKAFIIALTKSVSNQVAQRSIKEKRAMVRVNAISPGPIDTPLEFGAYGASSDNAKQYQAYVKVASVGVPMKRTGQPEEIAPAILFLGDPELSSYITGANISIDGGHTGSPLLCPCT